MNNVLLGKTIKAMYKLSGKTLTQLSDETELTVDTINNLFYARIQKPGLAGVNALVRAMGFSIENLISFLDANPDLSENSDVTERFTQFINADAADRTVKPAKPSVHSANSELSSEIELLNAEHEKQLDRFRATHTHYVEQLEAQHEKQVEQLKGQNAQMEKHFDKSVGELKALHEKETARLDAENNRLKKRERLLGILLGVESGIVMLMLILDVLNRSIGWFRR